MAISGTVQSLTAAFSFGILLQAASGALLVYWKGHGSTIFQDGRRLVLVLFLLFAALWAQIDFLNLLISPTASTTCQVGLIFSTTFDQLARVVLEQFLLWSIGNGTKLTAARAILQVVLGVRVVAGGVLAGFTRPQFAPSCVAHTSLLPVSIVVLALDGIIIGALLIQALSLGMFRDARGGQSSDRKDQSKAVIFTILGFAFWTGMSVTMILGLPSIELILRTTLPANGLLVLVGIVLIFQGALVSPRADESLTPEAHSPFMQQPLPPSREVLRDDVNIDGSPIAGRGYTKSGLFVVNPSATPTDSPKNKFDFQGNQMKGSNLRVRELEIPEQGMSRNGPGYRGSSGVFPSMVSAPLGGSFGGMSQGAYAPQIRPSAVAPPTIPAPTADQKKSLFNRSKPQKANIRSLGISQPIPTDAEGFSGPRMETVDLATAVASERERRDAASARTRLIADRPAPKPPTQTSQEGLRKSVSVKRKVTPATRVPLSPVPSGDSSSVGTSLVANGSSTSASLSPNRDEVRRRSPRSQGTGFGEKVMPKPTLQMKQTIGLPGNPRARMTMPKQADIGQPQTVMFMKDIVYDNPSIVKTIISGAPDMYSKRPKTAGSESIFSANFDFGELKSGNALQSSGSIIHRPRPYKRGNSKDRISFFGETSPRLHRRSKSQGSIVNRKSTLYSSSGSPTKLPPLPQHPPTSAANLPRILPGRVLPNDTKSMTFDEKVELLFPAPPGASLGNKRRSSVPSLPRVPSTFLAEVPTQIPTEEEQQNQRASKRTTISFGNQTPRQLSQISPPAGAKNNDPPTFRYSANTYAQLADDDLEDNDDVWQSGIPSQMPSLRTSVRDSVDNNPRRSSAVFHDMRRSILSEATSSDIESHGGETTNWGSVHSPAPAVEVSKARARSTFIQNNARAPPEPVPELPQEELDDGEEYIHIGIESEENRKSFLSMSDNNRRSFFLDAGQSLSGEFTSEPDNGGTWHRRIGDELPTFSERATKTRSRKMPPPTPLLLKTNGRQASVVVRQAEPSPEQSDAEAKALQEIQAQLKRFEQEPSRGSVGSLLQRIPNASQDDVSPHDAGGRFRLLENLEKEMGQQENQWQQMQSNFDRDSMSVVMTPSAPSEEALSRKSSQSSSRPPSRGVSRRARIRSNMTVLSKGEESASTQSSDNSRASVWQQRLAEAQLEYMENAPALLRKKSLNFLAVNKTDIGSPTPPDSENSEDEVDQQVESERQKAHNSLTKEIPSLWQAAFSADKTTSGRMWSPPVESFTVRVSSPEPPAKNVRPRQRRANEPLPIGSSEMWSKPSSAPHSRPVVALWGSKTVRPISIKTRPVTQRPQRKSKRVTFLPDIIESPQPLPNKRDTLGIFQFPWGERSEHPVYQPAFNPALLAGPAVSNAKLEARSRELESEEYSSSFFDDYEEDESEEELNEEESESDDDFDETTLWEIASLLQTDKIPSKNSLLPQPREAIEEYDEETDFEDSEDEAPVQSAMVKFPIEPLRKSLESAPRLSLWEGAAPASSVSPKGLPQPQPEVWQAYMPASDDVLRSKPHTSNDVPELATRELWTAATLATLQSTSTDMWTAKPTATIAAPSVVVAEPLPTTWTAKVEVVDDRHSGLFKPDAVRSTYRTTEAEPAASMLVRQPRQATLGLPTIVSQDLWFASEPEKEEIHWTSIPVIEVDVPKMWTAAIKAPAIDIEGLFTPDSTRTDYRTSNLEPAAMSMVSKPRTTVEPMPQLTTRRLWNRRDNVIYERHWISESSVRPDSPSIDSMPSSGRSSPSSETASLRTTSTKASSIWSSISGVVGAQAASRIPSFFETKAKSPKDEAPRESLPLKDDASMSQSKLPIRQIEPKEIKESKKVAKEPSKPLAPIRESRVFAARDLWEAKAPVLESTPVKKFWKRQAKAPQGPAKPTHRAIRHQYRPIVVYRANWEEALQEAIRAGTPKLTLVRRAATSAEWDNALAKAISQGKPRVERPQASREMWALALSEAISKSSTSLANSYNSAVLHPVFFTNSLIANSADIHPAAIGHVSLPRIQRPTASGLDWDMALAKAVSQSTPRVPRPTASPDMWSAALTEAISKSTVSASLKTSGYDPAVLHPVFFTDFLVSDISDIHPAAIGHAVKSADVAALFYDPALLHPVFFTESLVSSTSDIHPAAIGHAVIRPQLTPPKETQMWSNTSSTFSSTPGSPKDMPMWMKDEIFLQNRLSMFQHMEMESRRNRAPVRNLELSTLDSNSLFESRKHVEAAPYNWLEESKAPSTQTSSASTPRMSLNRISTWIPTPRASVNCAPGVLATVDMFTNVQSEHVKRVTPSRSTSLPRLSSTELFKVAPVSGPEVHWITARARSYTWTPTPRPSSISAPGTVATFDMFTNFESEPVKRATASRPAALPRLNSTELFKPAASPPSEVNWIAASSSKVVPRARSSTWVPTPQASSRPTPGAVATMDMFAEAFSEHVRKASSPRTSALASLESTELFRPITSDKVEVNWMMASTTAPKPQTWVAPIRKQPLATPGTLATNEMFANIKSEHVKKAKVARAASLPRLASIDLFKPASPRMSKAGVDWLKVSASKPTLSKSQTWVAPPAKRVAVAPGAIGSFEMFANINEDVKKVSVSRPAALPNLNSTELFQSASKADTNIDWLKRSSTKPAVKESRTWIAPTLAITPENNSMWTNSPTVSPLPADMFANIKGEHIKKASSSRPAALPRLSSTELFQPADNTTSERNWLQASSAVTEPKRLTWQAREVREERTSSSMWEASSTRNSLLESPEMFGDFNAGEWRRSKREPEEEKEIESSNMWRKEEDNEIDEMMNWMEQSMI